MNFPPNPTLGQTHSEGAGSPTYVWNGQFWGHLSMGTGREPVRFTPPAGATSISMTYQVGAEMVFRDGVLLERGTEYAATDGSTIVFGTAFAANEQVAVVPFHVITTLDAVRKDAGLADLQDKGAGRSSLQLDRFNRPRNRIINGGMIINQRSSGGETNGFVIDRWQNSNSGGVTGSIRAAHSSGATPGGEQFRIRATVLTAQASLSAAQYHNLFQIVEGLEVDDAALGTAAARQLLLRFGTRSSVAGTFGFSICNGDGSRTYVGQFTVAAGEVNQDVVRTFVIPAITAGTWNKDTGIGLYFRLCLGAGSNWQGSLGWGTANAMCTSAQTNLYATLGATFDLFDVGLYVDHAGHGIVPPYEPAGYINVLERCRRYFRYAPIGLRTNATGNGALYGGTVALDPPMRVRPSIGAAAAMPGTNGTTGTILTGFSVPYSSPNHIDYSWVATNSGDAYALGLGVALNAEL